MTGRRGLVAVALVVTAAAAWLLERERPLPPSLVVEDLVAELAPRIDPAAVVAQPSDGSVREATLEPGDPLRGDGPRASLVAPPPSRIRFVLEPPTGAVLRFSFGVDGDRKRERRSGIRFSVRLDGREAYARVVNPARRRDRRWFEDRLDLAAVAGRRVEVELVTDAERPDAPLAGTPGWTHVRLVRETRRPRQPASPSAPNVIVLLVDTLRADRLGCYGAHPSPTPTLDGLAASGILFEEMAAQASWTMPAVASLFTGLHPRSHGALGAAGRRTDDHPGGEFLGDALVTWAEEATRAGITTVGMSANPLVSRATNMAQGFETFVDFPWDPEGRNWMPAVEINRAFLGWLKRNRTYRFLAYLHYMEPHDPYVPAPALRAPAPPGVRPAVAAGWVRDLANAVNWNGGTPVPPAELAHLRRLYEGEVRTWDDALADLLGGLEALGLRGSTIIVVTADHGEEFLEHGHLTHGAHLYEESIRVPLVIAGPGIPPARRRDVAQGIDLFPTLAALLGIAPPPELPGRDLLATTAARPVFSETSRGIAPDGSRVQVLSVRDAGWKLIRTPALDRVELYDLAHDPAERADRYGSAPEGGRLGGLLADWQASARAAPRATERDPQLHEKLRALGYVE